MTSGLTGYDSFANTVVQELIDLNANVDRRKGSGKKSI